MQSPGESALASVERLGLRLPEGVEVDLTAAAALGVIVDAMADDRVPSTVREPAAAWRVHIADSLSGLCFNELLHARRIADLGSGAGFPGLPLAVVLREARVDLVESTGRKCEFIGELIAAADLDRAQVICDRAETLAAGEGREAYEAITARALGRLSTIAELASPLLADGGALVAWKGRRDAEEEAELARASPELAMTLIEVRAVGPYAGSRHRHLHLLQKTGPTPEGLPRRPGLAKKRPRGDRPNASVSPPAVKLLPGNGVEGR